MTQQRLNLLDLPTEILLHILKPFPTHNLLALTPLCRPVHMLILRLLHYRLLLAADDPSYRLILEAYHPSRRYTRPYLFCTYLGTDGLSSTKEGVGVVYEDVCGVGEEVGHLGKLGGLYSSFRPEHPDIEGSIPMRRIAGATPVFSQTSAVDGGDGGTNVNNTGVPNAAGMPATTPIYSNTGDGGARKIMYTINLDEGELFGQFCVYSQLVSGWKRRGIFDASVNIVEPGSGTIRIWREWLLRRCKVAYETQGVDEENEEPKGGELTRSSTFTCPNTSKDPDILWTDYKRNVGLRVQVRHRNALDNLKSEDKLEDDVLSCDLIVQELVVRTTHLMLAVEAAAASMQGNNGSGNASYITWTMLRVQNDGAAEATNEITQLPAVA